MRLALTGAEYALDEAVAVVVGYCVGREPARLASAVRRRPPGGLELGELGENPAFGYSFYDGVPRGVPPGGDDRLAYAADAVTANALNARMTGRELAQLVGALPEVNRHLARIPAGFTLLDAHAAELASWEGPGRPETKAMHAAWWSAARLHGIAAARANKLLHRVRPDVFPLYDDLTGPLLGSEPWVAVWYDLDRNRRGFADLREAVTRHPATTGTAHAGLLRLHDILLWCHAAGKRDYAASLAART